MMYPKMSKMSTPKTQTKNAKAIFVTAKALIKNCVILSKQIQLTTEKITIIIRKDKSTSSIIRSLRDSSLTTYKVILPSFYMNFLIFFCQYLLFLKESNKSVSTFHYIKIKKTSESKFLMVFMN